MDETLANSIEALPRDQALEAARFLAEAMDVTSGESDTKAVEPLTTQPFQNIEEIDQLARLLLLAAASDPELEEKVRQAIDGAGHKQFIFGGLEIVALAVLAITALHVVITKGKKSESEKIKIEEKPDGTTVTTIDRKVTYGISAKLAGVLNSYFGK
jgi:hypothetical protein